MGKTAYPGIALSSVHDVRKAKQKAKQEVSPEQILRAMEHYGLTLFGPPRTGVPKNRRWHARDEECTRQGWGSTPAEAVEAAIAIAITKPEPEEWDFLG